MSAEGMSFIPVEPTHILDGKPSRNFLMACICGKGSRKISLPVEHYGLGSSVKDALCAVCGEKTEHIILRMFEG